MSSKKFIQKPDVYWGTEPEYFPFQIHVAPLEDSDLEQSKNLTPSERIEWLLMMQKLLIEQFSGKSLVPLAKK